MENYYFNLLKDALIFALKELIGKVGDEKYEFRERDFKTLKNAIEKKLRALPDNDDRKSEIVAFISQNLIKKIIRYEWFVPDDPHGKQLTTLHKLAIFLGYYNWYDYIQIQYEDTTVEERLKHIITMSFVQGHKYMTYGYRTYNPFNSEFYSEQCDKYFSNIHGTNKIVFGQMSSFHAKGFIAYDDQPGPGYRHNIKLWPKILEMTDDKALILAEETWTQLIPTKLLKRQVEGKQNWVTALYKLEIEDGTWKIVSRSLVIPTWELTRIE